MSEHLRDQFDLADPKLISAYDEAPLWSAMAGILLLENAPLRPNYRALDVGCGTGFPLLDLAQRLGPQGSVVGIDRWVGAVERASAKAKTLRISNVEIVIGDAAEMRWSDSEFDLVVSNLGINNFDNPAAVLAECFRMTKPGGTIALTTNLRGHWKEFYDLFALTLKDLGLASAQKKLQAHVDHRTTVESLTTLLRAAGYERTRTITRTMPMRYATGTAFLRHTAIRMGFVEAWRKILTPETEQAVFDHLENKLNEQAAKKGELHLTVPIAYFDAKKSGA